MYDTGHTTLATPDWPIMSGGGTEAQSLDLIFGAGMRIVTPGVYIRQQFGSGTGDRTSFDALNESMAFSIWLKAPTVSTAARVLSLQGSYYVALQEDDEIRFRFFGTPSPNIFIPYTPGVWAHWAFTYDGTNLKIYKDGELIRTTAFRNMSKQSNKNISLLCRDNDGARSEFLPADTEVAWICMVWGGARNDAEVRDLYRGVRYLTPYAAAGRTGAFRNFSFLEYLA